MNTKKILIVEDEKGMREALEDAFEETEYEVFSAQDGEGAVKAIIENKPDIILLDLILPKKDGFEVLKEIKEKPDTKDIPVVLCTNLSDMQDIQKAIDLGAKTYLLKANYSLADIVSKVNKVLSGK